MSRLNRKAKKNTRKGKTAVMTRYGDTRAEVLRIVGNQGKSETTALTTTRSNLTPPDRSPLHAYADALIEHHIQKAKNQDPRYKQWDRQSHDSGPENKIDR